MLISKNISNVLVASNNIKLTWIKVKSAISLNKTLDGIEWLNSVFTTKIEDRSENYPCVIYFTRITPQLLVWFSRWIALKYFSFPNISFFFQTTEIPCVNIKIAKSICCVMNSEVRHFPHLPLKFTLHLSLVK